MTEELLAFFRARLVEERALAEASAAEPWHFYPDGHYGAVVEFLDRWNPVDPVLVLADIAAKEAMLDEFSWEAGEVRIVMRLVQVYAGHPEFRAQWRVDPAA